MIELEVVEMMTYLRIPWAVFKTKQSWAAKVRLIHSPLLFWLWHGSTQVISSLGYPGFFFHSHLRHDIIGCSAVVELNLMYLFSFRYFIFVYKGTAMFNSIILFSAQLWVSAQPVLSFKSNYSIVCEYNDFPLFSRSHTSLV